MLEDCGLLGSLDVVHEELGVEELLDLAHVSRADLKDARGLKPVKRNKLIKCICALEVRRAGRRWPAVAAHRHYRDSPAAPGSTRQHQAEHQRYIGERTKRGYLANSC